MNNSQLKSKQEGDEFIFSIAPNGKITAIYDDRIADFLASGKTTITRASQVEPHPDGGWIADMSPSGEDVILGPFPLRQQALDAECEFLKAKLFG